MNFTLLAVVLGAFVLCCLAMAVGLIFRGKTFTSCGSASRDFNGEKITCPGCSGDGQCRKEKQ